MPISWAMNIKTKDALLSQTLKVREKKVASVFFDLWPRSQDTAISTLEAKEVEYVPSSKCLYFDPWVMNIKSKETLKAEERKLSLFFMSISSLEDI